MPCVCILIKVLISKLYGALQANLGGNLDASLDWFLTFKREMGDACEVKMPPFPSKYKSFHTNLVPFIILSVCVKNQTWPHLRVNEPETRTHYEIKKKQWFSCAFTGLQTRIHARLNKKSL